MMAGSEERKAELITSYFKKMFEQIEYPPTKMDIPFSGEVHKAANRLKNGKSGDGIDKLHSEYIKYADKCT